MAWEVWVVEWASNLSTLKKFAGAVEGLRLFQRVVSRSEM